MGRVVVGNHTHDGTQQAACTRMMCDTGAGSVVARHGTAHPAAAGAVACGCGASDLAGVTRSPLETLRLRQVADTR